VTRVDLTRLRQAVYRLAGAGFLAPSPQTTLGTAGSIPILSDLGLFDFPYSLALVDYIHRLADSDFDELTAAYMALFEVGVGGAASPRGGAMPEPAVSPRSNRSSGAPFSGTG
jgi:hypothetical protein